MLELQSTAQIGYMMSAHNSFLYTEIRWQHKTRSLL